MPASRSADDKQNRDFPVFKLMPCATANEVRNLRTRMNLTQAELAKEMGVSEYSVWRWEHGQRPITQAHTKLLRILAKQRAWYMGSAHS